MNDANKQIKLGAVVSYLAIFFNILTGLLFTPWMIGKIGQADYSLYTLSNSIISLFLVDFGLSAATARFVALYRTKNEVSKINDFLGIVYKIYLAVDALIVTIFTLVFFNLSNIYTTLSADEIIKLKVVFFISAGYSVISFPFITLNGILTAYERFIELKFFDLNYRLLVVGLNVILLSNGHGLFSIVAVNAIVGLLLILAKLVVIKRKTMVQVNMRYWEKTMFSNIAGFSLWSTINSLALRLIFNIIPSILGMCASSADIAVFGIVTTIEGYSYTITNAINGMFLSRITSLYNSEESEKHITSLMIKVGRFQFFLCALIFVGFVCVGEKFILLWVGSDFLDAYMGIIFVLFPSLFFNAMQIGINAMMVQNKVRYQAYIAIITGAINVVLCYSIASRLGVIGACAAVCISCMLRVVLYLSTFRRSIHLDVKRFIYGCYLKMSAPIIISLLAGRLLKGFFVECTWMSLIMNSVVVVFIYLLSSLVLSLTSDEKKYLITKLRRI